MEPKSGNDPKVLVPSSNTPPETRNRKYYRRPIIRALESEQATLLLVGHAYEGHQGAREILEILFPARANKDTRVVSQPVGH